MKILLGALACLVLVALVIALTQSRGMPSETKVLPSAVSSTARDSKSLEQGRYLVTAGNCISCHTRPDGRPFAGGLPIVTPLGTIYSTNITPDTETGIGRWSEADFIRAMREGIAADGHRLYPAFPYTSFTKVSDDDVRAIYAYLVTLGPVRYKPPQNDAIFSQRWGMRVWDVLFFTPGRYTNDTARSAEWNRGAYLTTGLGHCAACHSPRNRFMAEIASGALSGGQFQNQGTDGKQRRWSGVNLTPSPSGLGAWSADDIVNYLKDGFTQRGGSFGPMNEVIVNSTRHLSAGDLHAIAVYLKSLPTQETVADRRPNAEQLKEGGAVYAERCETCHLSSGRGGLFKGPRLAGSAVVQAQDPATLINVILFGPDAPTGALGAFASWETMKAYKEILSDDETAAVSNYIRNSWGNKGSSVAASDVSRQR